MKKALTQAALKKAPPTSTGVVKPIDPITKSKRATIADLLNAIDVSDKLAKVAKPTPARTLVPVAITPPAPAKKALFALTDVIIINQYENPARAGTKTWLSYELLLKCETVGEFLAAANLPNSGITDPRSTLYNRSAKGDICIIDTGTCDVRISAGIKWYRPEGSPKHVPVPRDPNAPPKAQQPTVTSTGLTLAPAKRTKVAKGEAKVSAFFAESAKAVKAKRALEVVL